jgi:tetratricopeptide (TPR) repeat protein
VRRALPLLLAAVAVAGCASDAERRDQHLAKAESSLAEGDTRTALIEFRSALELDPQNADVNFRVGRALEAVAAVQDALFFYEEAYRLDPMHSEAAMRAASFLLEADPERAEEIVAEVLEREPGNDFAYVLRSRAALLRNDAEGALAPALTAIELDPDDPFTHEQLGKVHAARIRALALEDEEAPEELYRSAVEAFEAGRELADEELRWHFSQYRARILANWKGQEAEAAEAFRRAIAEAETVSPGAVQQVLPEASRFASRTEDKELLAWVSEQRAESFPGQLGAWTELARLAEERDGSGEAVMQRMIEAQPESGEARVAYARYLLGQQRSDEAVAYLEASAAEGVDPPLLLSVQANTLYALQREPEAKAIIERLAQEYPEHSRTLLAMAQQAAMEQRLDDGVELLERLVDRDASPEALRMLAGLERRRGNLQLALASAQRAVAASQQGGFPQAAVLLQARLQVETGDCQGAVRSYTQVRGNDVALSPEDRVYLARCLYATGRGPLGKRILQSLAGEDAQSPMALIELARLEARTDPELARRLVDRGLERWPRFPALLGIAARLDAAEGRTDLALERLNSALGGGAGAAAPELLLLRAQLLVARGELEQAERDAMLAFQRQPELTAAGQLVVQIYRAQGRIEEAIESFEEVLAAGSLDVGARVLLARLHLAAGHEARAEELLEGVLAERSDLPEAKNDLAYLLARRGADLDRALELATDAQQGLGELPPVADTLGYVYLRRGLPEAALAQFRATIELAEAQQTMTPLYPFHLGLALRELGLEAEAEQAFEQALSLDPDYEDALTELRLLRQAQAEEGAPSEGS